MLQELRRHARVERAEETILAIRRAIADMYGLDVWTVQLLRPGSLARTVSGKLERQQCRVAFLRREIEPLAEWSRASPHALRARVPLDATSIENWLLPRLATRLGVATAST